MYDRTRVLNRLEDPFEFARIAHIWKVYDKQKLVELHGRCTLEGLASKIRCPLLVVHGELRGVPNRLHLPDCLILHVAAR